jgi:hypothetical protein
MGRILHLECTGRHLVMRPKRNGWTSVIRRALTADCSDIACRRRAICLPATDAHQSARHRDVLRRHHHIFDRLATGFWLLSKAFYTYVPRRLSLTTAIRLLNSPPWRGWAPLCLTCISTSIVRRDRKIPFGWECPETGKRVLTLTCQDASADRIEHAYKDLESAVEKYLVWYWARDRRRITKKSIKELKTSMEGCVSLRATSLSGEPASRLNPKMTQ